MSCKTLQCVFLLGCKTPGSVKTISFPIYRGGSFFRAARSSTASPTFCRRYSHSLHAATSSIPPPSTYLSRLCTRHSKRLNMRQADKLSNLQLVRRYSEDTQREPRKVVGGAEISRHRIEWLNTFRSILEGKEASKWTVTDWETLSEQTAFPNGPSWDILCMNALYRGQSVHFGKSFMNYLEEKGLPISQIILTYFIGLLGETSQSAEQDDETKAYYDKLMSSCDVLDPASIEVLVSGLSNTKYYKECLKLSEMYRETSVVQHAVLSNILKASLKFKDLQLCESTLSAIEESVEVSNLSGMYWKLIDTCLASDNAEGLKVVMEFFQKHNLLVPMNQVERIADAFHRYQPDKWSIKTSYIHQRSGRCVNCQHQMDIFELTDSEFRSIQEVFLKHVIVEGNIFYKSTPQEVEKFIKFVEERGPFDVVIDGMNVVHRIYPKRPATLEKAVKYFHEQDKRVLLLGSWNLQRHITNYMKNKLRPAIFLTNTTKADDAFFLYAALQSGKNTLIVSQDKLRDHKFRIGLQLKHLFHKWLRSVQIYNYFLDKGGEFGIGRSQLFDVGPCSDEHGWHLPLNDITMTAPYGKMGVICVRDSEHARTKRHYPEENRPRRKEFQRKRETARGKENLDTWLDSL